MFKLINYFFLVFVIFTGSVFNTFATNLSVIYDSEISDTLDTIVKPLKETANLPKLKIIVLDDNTLNAFTAGKNIIYISSGLIKRFSNVDVIRGVLAHEIGHIVSNHIFRHMDNVNNLSKVLASSVAVGLLTGLLSGNGELGMALSMLGNHIVERSYLKYSRTCEASADQFAFKLLEKNGFSASGMLEFFELSNKNRLSKELINPYEQTHPLDNERLTTIKHFLQKSLYPKSYNEPQINYQYQRIRAKLFAFTEPTKKSLEIIEQRKDYLSEELVYYIKAISYFRGSDFTNAIKYIDKLLVVKNNDPFYHELKGQILFGFGKKSALESYETALKLRPHDTSIKLSRAIVALNIYEKNINNNLDIFYKDIKNIANVEKNNYLVLYYLSIFHEKFNEKGLSLLSQAQLAILNDDYKKAKSLAKTSLPLLKNKSPEWYKAYDIINTIE